MFHKSARPAHLYSVNFCGRSETEVHPQIVLGDVTRTAAHFIYQSSLSSCDRNLCTHAVTVGTSSQRSKSDPAISRTGRIHQKARLPVNIVDDDGELTIVPQIAHRQAARGRSGVNSGSCLRRDVGESGIAIVVVKKAWFHVSATQVKLVDLRIDVSVGEDEVGPTVIVEVEKHGPPAQILRMRTESGSEGNVRKKSLTIVAVKGRGVIGEVGFKNIQPAVAVVIGDGGAHSRLFSAILVERNSSSYSNVGKGAIAIVAIEDAWSTIAGNVDIRPAIIVKIEGGNAHRVMSIGLADVSLACDIREGPVTPILIQNVFRARQAARSAHHRHAFPHARASLTRGRGRG